LNRLNVAQTLIGDAALEELAQTLPQSLNLLRQRAVDELLAAGCRIEPSGDPLATSFSAVHMSMMDVRVTPAHFRYLRELPGLNDLHISHGRFTEQLADTIAELSDLQTLSIQDGDFSGDDLVRLKPLRKLSCMKLQQLAIDDEALRHIGHFSGLRELHLDITKVTGLPIDLQPEGDAAEIPAEIIDLPEPCPSCGRWDFWQDLRGTWHCEACSPRTAGPRLRELAERLRTRYGGPVADRQARPVIRRAAK